MEELILKEAEYRNKIVQLTNESKLPAFIIKSVVKDLYEEIINIEKQQYEQALNYKQQKELEEKKGDKNE